MPDLLAGHLYPGCGFAFLGFWWSLSTAIRYIRAENHQMRNKQRANPYRSSPSIPMLFAPCSCLQRPCIESIVKLLASLAGIIWHTIEVKQLERNRQSAITISDLEHSSIINRINSTNSSGMDSMKEMSMILTHRTKHHVVIYIGFFLGAIFELMIHARMRLPKKLGKLKMITRITDPVNY